MINCGTGAGENKGRAVRIDTRVRKRRVSLDRGRFDVGRKRPKLSNMCFPRRYEVTRGKREGGISRLNVDYHLTSDAQAAMSISAWRRAPATPSEARGTHQESGGGEERCRAGGRPERQAEPSRRGDGAVGHGGTQSRRRVGRDGDINEIDLMYGTGHDACA